MYRNGVAGKGVHGQHVKLLGRFAFQGETRVTHHDVGSGLRVAQVAERVPGDGDDLWVDLVEAEVVAGFAVGGDGARSETDHANAPGSAAATIQGQPYAGVGRVVGGGLQALRRVDELRAVLDLAVVELAVGLFEPVAKLLDA